MSESVKLRKIVEIKYWFRENWKKLLAAGFLAFVVLSITALTEGIGYEATVKISSVEIIVPNHPCYGFFITGNVTCTFNPFLYPITNIFGYKNNLNFIRVSEPYDFGGRSVKDTVEIMVLLQEFPKNIPFYLLISFVAALGTVKLIERFGKEK